MNEDIDVTVAGWIESGSNYTKAKIVYDIRGLAPALTTCHLGIGLPKIEIPSNYIDTGVVNP